MNAWRRSELTQKGTAIRRNEIDPDQAQVVRRIFSIYAQGTRAIRCGMARRRGSRGPRPKNAELPTLGKLRAFLGLRG